MTTEYMYYVVKKTCDGDFEYNPYYLHHQGLKGDVVSLIYVNKLMKLHINGSVKIYPAMSKVDIIKVKDQRLIYLYLMSFDLIGEFTSPIFPIIRSYNNGLYEAFNDFYNKLNKGSNKNINLNHHFRLEDYSDIGIYDLIGSDPLYSICNLHQIPSSYDKSLCFFNDLQESAQNDYDEALGKYSNAVNENASKNLGRQYKLNYIHRSSN